MIHEFQGHLLSDVDRKEDIRNFEYFPKYLEFLFAFFIIIIIIIVFYNSLIIETNKSNFIGGQLFVVT